MATRTAEPLPRGEVIERLWDALERHWAGGCHCAVEFRAGVGARRLVGDRVRHVPVHTDPEVPSNEIRLDCKGVGQDVTGSPSGAAERELVPHVLGADGRPLARRPRLLAELADQAPEPASRSGLLLPADLGRG